MQRVRRGVRWMHHIPDSPRGPAGRFARAVVRGRLYVVGGWIAIVVLAQLVLPSYGSGTGGGLQGLVPTDSPAIQAEIDSFRFFGFPLSSRTMVVQRGPEGLSRAAQARVFLRALRLNRGDYPRLGRIEGALPLTNTLGLFPGSRERSTTAITFLFFLPDVSLSLREGYASRFAREAVDEPGDGLIGVTGAAPGRIAEGRLIKEALPKVEVATLLLILVIVGVHFRSVLAPVTMLFAAGIAYFTTLRSIEYVSGIVGLGLPEELEPLIVVLLLGIVTDYSIFFMAGMEASLREGRAPLEAALEATRVNAPIIVTAGLTVAAGTGALYVASIGAFQALGPGLALTVLVGLAVSVTFIPAMLALLRRAMFWPHVERSEKRARVLARLRRGYESMRNRAAARWSHRKPAALIALVSIIVLLIPAASIKDMGLGFSIVSGLPRNSEARAAARAAALGFAPGIVSPTVLVMRGGGVGRSLERLVLAQSLIERFPGVAATVGPREIGILSRSLQELPGSEAVPADVLRPLRQAMIAPRSDAARLVVILDDPPLGAEAIENLRYLRRQTPAILRAVALGDTSSAFAGDTALAADTIDRTIDDLRRVGVAVILVSLLTLVLFLRSLVAPVYLVIASVLGFLASLGLTVTVFQSWLDQGSLSFLVPFASGVLLVSLGSDYTIFLAGQIWAEARTTSFRRAVAQATPRASGPITVAGVTLASSFAMLALVPLAAFRQIAFALAAGVLIDTFIVRSFLVPALIALVGRASGWPSRSVGRNEE